MSGDCSLPIQVLNPRKLPLWRLPAERIPVGIPGDYKPSLALLPDGELIMVAFHQTGTQRKSDFHEVTTFWRSTDGGKTWSDRDDRPDIIGREQFLSRTRAGTLFMSSHITAADNAYDGPKGSYHSYLHRSTDGGKTWQRTRVRLEGPERRGVAETEGTATDRNVVELPDGTLLFGVALDNSPVAYMWRSTDNGKSWDRNHPCRILGYYDNVDGFFSNSFTHLNEAGKLLHWLRCGPPSPMYPMTDGRGVPSTDDAGDRTMWTHSKEHGLTWSPVADFGDYGQMYALLLKLHDGRLLMTFTQRGMTYPLGLRAILSYDDGETWDLQNDLIIIEGKTPWMKASGGGFGNTVELADRTLVSAYTYRGEDDRTHLEVVRWRLPIAEARPHFFVRRLLEMKDRRKLTVLCDWSGRAGARVLPYDICQRDSGKPQSRITRVRTTVAGEKVRSRLRFLSTAQSGDPCTGLSFVNLPMTDWTGSLAVAMRLHNPTSRPQELAIWVWDEDKAGPFRKQTFAPGETGTLFLARDEMQSEVDLSRMRAVVLLSLDPRAPKTFLAGPLCLVNP